MEGSDAARGVFDVRWVAEADLPALRRFLERNYPAAHPLRNQEYFDFWFRRDGQPIGVIIAELRGNIIGIQGIIRSRISWRGADYPAAWYCNTFVEREHRMRGIGLRLLAFSVARCPNLLTLSYTRESGALLERLGFSFFERAALRRYWRLLDADAYATLANAGPLPEGAIEAPAHAREAAVRVVEAEPSIERVWRAVEGKYGLTTSRAQGWIERRYFGHPIYDYHVLTVAGAAGYCVVRFEPEPARRVARIVDWWGKESDIPPVFEAASAYAAGQGACFVDFFTTATRLGPELAAARFRLLDGAAAWEVPYLFHPPERRERFNEGFAALLSGLPDGGPATPDELYFVKADGDRDR